MKDRVVVVGELAVHAFVPATPGAHPHIADEAPLQLGGGAGMMARHLRKRGEDFCALTFAGEDASGRFLSAELDALGAGGSHVSVPGEQSSVVFLHYSTHVEDMTILPGGASVRAIEPLLLDVRRTDWVYCPYFPGYERGARLLAERSERLVLDFGYFDHHGDETILAERISSAPPARIALLNGADLTPDASERLLDRATQRGFDSALLTRGSEPALVSDRGTRSAVRPPKGPVRCTIGAGDVLVAELLVHLKHSTDFRTACARGVDAASRKCAHWGIG